MGLPQGTGQYQIEKTLAPGQQMALDFAELIRDAVPDKFGHTLPAGLTSGTYHLLDLNNNPMGSLYEGKEIVDKTWGHTTYTCMICCGPNNPSMKFDPLDLQLEGFDYQAVQALNSCTGKLEAITSDYPTWWTNDTTIATANGAKITGVGVGSTYHNAQSIYMYMGPKADSGGSEYPGSQDEEAAQTNVTPTVTIDSFSPNPIEWGLTATVHLTVSPSAPISLAISNIGSNATGRADFTSSGSTSMTITGTTSVTIQGDATSQPGAADLELTASYQGTLLAITYFSVATGACNATYSTHGGDGVQLCPAQNVHIYDTYSMQNYCSSCQLSCVPATYDNSFTPSNCTAVTAGPPGQNNPVLTSTAVGTFAPSDCNIHTVQIQTTIVNTGGQRSQTTGASFALSCNSNGSPACH